MEREDGIPLFSNFSFLNAEEKREFQDFSASRIFMDKPYESGRFAYEFWRRGKKREIYSAFRNFRPKDQAVIYAQMTEDIVSCFAVAISLREFPHGLAIQFVSDFNITFIKAIYNIPLKENPDDYTKMIAMKFSLNMLREIYSSPKS